MEDSPAPQPSPLSQNKRKRADSSTYEEEDANPAGDPLRLLANLPSNAIQHVLSFPAHRDRLSLAATCTDMRDEVEVYSKSTLANFKKNHRVDETFAARIRDQSSIATTRSKPVDLPFRYLLWVCKKTHLYKLGEPSQRDVSMCCSLALSPSGDRILIAEEERRGRMIDGGRGIVSVVDLSTKQRILTIEHGLDRIDDMRRVFYFGDLIVSCSWCVIRVWNSETGELKFEHRPESEIVADTWKPQNRGLLYMSVIDKVHWLNIQTGDLVTHSLPAAIRRKFAELGDFEILVCNDKWLVLNIDGWSNDGEHHSEIFLIDLSDHSIKQVIKGHTYSQLVQSSDCSMTIYGFHADDSLVDVFEVVDGCLSQCFSFQVSVENHLQILTVSQSHFVARFRGGDQCLGIFNAETGKLKKRLVPSPQQRWYSTPVLVSETRQEVFVGLYTERADNGGDIAPTVLAYSLKDD